jgi:flagellar basal-body rod modification protein FlgD
MSTTIPTDPTAASSGTLSNATSSATGNSAMGETQFLQLLTAQLQNQDPLNPMDDTTFVAELAQFSSVEQLTSVNTNLQSLMVAQASSNDTSAASLIGTQVLYNSGSVALGATGGATLYANLGSAAASGTAVITNAAGQTVRTLQFGSEPSGAVQIPWDGTDDQGNALPPGTYTVTITANDSSGNPVTVTSQAEGLVTGVNFSAGYPQLLINGNEVQMSNVDQINQAPPAA